MKSNHKDTKTQGQDNGTMGQWDNRTIGIVSVSPIVPLSYRPIVLLVLCIIFFHSYFPLQSECAFEDDYLGAGSMGMGGAYAALAKDVDGILINPAGLSKLDGQQLMAVFSALYLGLSDNSFISQNILGYAYKQNRVGTIGFAWKRFGVANLYSEDILAVAIGRDFGFYLKKSEEKRRKNFSFGATLKLLNWDSAPTVGADGKVVEDLPGWTGFGFDLGFLIWPSENISVAFALQNLSKPNIASEYSKVVESLPITGRIGVAASGEKMTWIMDMSLAEGEVDLRTGLERKAYDGDVLLRAGFSLENLAWGTNFTLGAGYKPRDSIRIDYAFVYPVNTILDTIGSHRISVVYDF